MRRYQWFLWPIRSCLVGGAIKHQNIHLNLKPSSEINVLFVHTVNYLSLIKTYREFQTVIFLCFIKIFEALFYARLIKRLRTLICRQKCWSGAIKSSIVFFMEIALIAIPGLKFDDLSIFQHCFLKRSNSFVMHPLHFLMSILLIQAIWLSLESSSQISGGGNRARCVFKMCSEETEPLSHLNDAPAFSVGYSS